MVEIQSLVNTDVLGVQFVVFLVEVIEALFSDHDKLEGVELFHQVAVVFLDVVEGCFDNVAVKGAAKTPVCRNDNHRDSLNFPSLQERVELRVYFCHKMTKKLVHLPRIGPGCNNSFLRATKFCGRDHFHGFRDFLSVFDTGDAPPYFA